MEVTKTMTIEELIKKNDNVASVLMDFGMVCVECPNSQGETLEEACMVYGIEVDELLKKLYKI